MEEMVDNNRFPKRVYGVSFVCSSESKGIQYPQIVFSLSSKHAREADRLLAQCSVDSQSDASDAIFPRFDTPFVSTETCFGFASCGTRDEAVSDVLDYKVQYKINLKGHELVRDILLTTGVLCEILGMVFATSEPDEEDDTRNYSQLMTIKADYYTHGYSVSGYVHPSLGYWLADYGKYKAEKGEPFTREFFKGSALPESVCHAMQNAWEAIVPDDLKEYSGECYAGIKQTGCFTLSCFGDACDVAIYHDLAIISNPGHRVEFGCHNVTAPWQAITLVAGLAALHDLAAQELG